MPEQFSGFDPELFYSFSFSRNEGNILLTCILYLLLDVYTNGQIEYEIPKNSRYKESDMRLTA